MAQQPMVVCHKCGERYEGQDTINKWTDSAVISHDPWEVADFCKECLPDDAAPPELAKLLTLKGSDPLLGCFQNKREWNPPETVWTVTEKGADPSDLYLPAFYRSREEAEEAWSEAAANHRLEVQEYHRPGHWSWDLGTLRL